MTSDSNRDLSLVWTSGSDPTLGYFVTFIFGIYDIKEDDDLRVRL